MALEWAGDPYQGTAPISRSFASEEIVPLAIFHRMKIDDTIAAIPLVSLDLHSFLPRTACTLTPVDLACLKQVFSPTGIDLVLLLKVLLC